MFEAVRIEENALARNHLLHQRYHWFKFVSNLYGNCQLGFSILQRPNGKFQRRRLFWLGHMFGRVFLGGLLLAALDVFEHLVDEATASAFLLATLEE